ncbi:hypothetical protein BSK49_11085 [Paenibacillus odorifer]|uniref:hypothetical protein n=1 Tax=Paenibacillus TaxID=44249 RepID=UPI00096E7185|nr:hypothetical protein [Paenibacillus odorifer]OMC65109.1 hypothetical protein BK121_22995 [Paenibacillus odorifer]OMD56958.1 hypothetical protein BSK55_19220 [Paenibacillus odorifer]OMD89898.1 hypothetical protein BSK49_11085 [Paenibacillus odorifer]
MLVLLFSVIAVGCMALDLPKLMRKRRVPDLSVYFIFWILGLGATFCSLLKLNIPSPLFLIIFIYKPINNLFGLLFH